MNELERRSRRALRWYPRRWRARHEEALLGILLDQAEAEGRNDMSPADRHDLARRGLRRRLAPLLLAALLALAVLAVLQGGTLVADGIGPDVELFLVVPRLGPVPPADIHLCAWTVHLICAAIVASAATGTVLLLHGMRRA